MIVGPMLRAAALVATGGLVAAAGIAGVERRYRRHPGNDLDVADEGWSAERISPTRWTLRGTLVVTNPIPDREVMLTDVQPRVQLLATGPVEACTVQTRVRSLRPDYPARADGYWVSYVVKPGHYHATSPIAFEVDIDGPEATLGTLQAVWVEIRLATYGFEGSRDRFHHVVIPLSFPDPDRPAPWQEAAGGRAQVRAVRTHLLGPSDDPAEVVVRYAAPHAQPGDIVAIGESPLAVIQGRFHDPRNLRRTWAATRLAQFMHGEGALGTPGGMQSLMNEHGAARVAGAMVGGALGKAVGQAGWFYRLAGEQARLVDDVTGTIAPYDNFVVVGPADSDAVCAAVTARTGLAAVVVDANDLGKVDVVGASPGVDHELVRAALRANPAGNADESTPLVLIRPGGPAAPSAVAALSGSAAEHRNERP
ncbi:MAG: F420-0:Gamma-glutamyl ligase [Acidimicrobiales bacterium]